MSTSSPCRELDLLADLQALIERTYAAETGLRPDLLVVRLGGGVRRVQR
jgi:hypothetical protein